ncbi:YagU family protein [Erwiniaceae bacterium CAU 1747]
MDRQCLVTSKSYRRYSAALIAGFFGGNIASFVKWGSENPFPPRTADRAIPPAEMLNDFGLNTDAMIYHWSGHVVNWGVAGIHHLFSIFFAMLYCWLAEIFPAVKMWQGAAFALVITVIFHGIVLPAGGWAPSFWDLPADEILSETFGHIIWMWTIEIFRRDLRNRITKARDAEDRLVHSADR